MMSKKISSYIIAFESWRHKNIIVATFSTALVLLFLFISDNRIYPFDSRTYFTLSESFVQEGSFSLLNYPASIRGVTFPLVLFVFNRISDFIWNDPLFGWRLLISLLSGIFVLAFPVIFKGIGKVYSLPIPLIALLFVWFGLFLAPLADLISAFFLVFSLALIRIGYDKIKHQKKVYLAFLMYVLSGLFLYSAYNTRTIYMAAIVGVLLLLISIKANGKNGWNHMILIFAAICIGVFLGGLPQAISNQHTINSFSLAVPTHFHSDRGLNLFQLREGLRMNLYETSMVEGEPAAFIYWNRLGLHIINEHGSPQSIGEYLSFALRYPLEFLGTYMRHLIVLLNPISGGGYIGSRNNMRFIYTVINYSILFITFGFLKRKFLDNSFKNTMQQVKTISQEGKMALISIVAILLPFAAILPGAVEERFAIPFWLVIYGLICYCINLKQEFVLYKKRPVSYLILYLMGFAIMMAILTDIYANNDAGIFLPILYLGR